MVDASYPSFQWWPLWAFYFLFIIAFPIYLFIFVILIRLRKSNSAFRSSFYTLLLQQIIADLISLVFFLIFKITTSVFTEYFFIQDDIPFAQIYFNSVYWTIVYRAHGIVLLTIHRYLFILNEKPWLIWFRFWIPPTIFNLIFFLDTKIRFGMGQILIFAMDTLIVDRYAEAIIVFLSISCLICFVSYILIILFVRSKSNAMSQSIKRELRLALQMILPCFGLFVLQVYMSFLHCFATNDNVRSPRIIKTKKNLLGLHDPMDPRILSTCKWHHFVYRTNYNPAIQHGTVYENKENFDESKVNQSVCFISATSINQISCH
ncbi:hypothetical protein B9Z55_013445 [Caenorhabditis nigoni]|uniref:Serpentine receptor class gamma n=1 Tax=Caenorhabditis nigoni TaxID=1611254 RepID=A0A2G5U1Q5_9PELO|nr:hypothetical protein B9Z55_013445 [Caenorhabditis nigoni]